VARYHTRLLEGAAIGTTDRVLDIGCGCGRSTIDAARAARSGAAHGVDLSAPMLERARARAAAEGVTNATFEQGDAQVHPLGDARFDVAISRFGAMFFGDPVAAFANIGRALRADGRMALMSWQPLERNEWLSAIRGALAMARELPAPACGAPGPFGLAEPDAVRDLLGTAGFVDVELTAVREPMTVGADADDAYGFVSRMPPVRGMLQDLDDATGTRALEQLCETIAAHAAQAGVTFDSAGWLITARHP
jgi:SAM-dependent methyltransferase